MFWAILYALINVIILIRYVKMDMGVVKAPFLMAYASLFVLLPQLFTVTVNPFYDTDNLPFFSIFISLCNVSFVVGFERSINKRRQILINKFTLKNVWFVFFVTLILGLTSLFFWNDSFQGSDNVIPVTLKGFAQYSCCLVLVDMLHSKNKVGIQKKILLLISVFPLIYFAFFVKGSRSEIVFLLLLFAYYLYKKYPLKYKKITLLFFIALVAGSVLSASIEIMRKVYIYGDLESQNDKISYFDTFVSSFSDKSEMASGLDMGNAMIGIEYLRKHNQVDFGFSIWDDIVQDFVPSRFVGDNTKNALKFNIVNDSRIRASLSQGVTTMTGYYFAYRYFSFLGFIFFGLMGYLFGYFWQGRLNSMFYEFAYLALLGVLVSLFSHEPRYVYSKLFYIYVIIKPLGLGNFKHKSTGLFY